MCNFIFYCAIQYRDGEVEGIVMPATNCVTVCILDTRQAIVKRRWVQGLARVLNLGVLSRIKYSDMCI